LLGLARAQGVLYASQLPPVNGNGSDRARQLLTRLFASRPADLEPVRPDTIDCVDTDLDAGQREAVAKALHTPDVCLIQGLPGTGRSRVAAEIVIQAAQRGERVLLLSPVVSAVDRVLEQVGTRDVLCPIRCLGRDERPETLAPAVRALTFAERVRQLGDQALQESRRQIETAEQRYQRRREDEPRLARCLELAESGAQLEAQLTALEQKRAQLADDVLHAAEAGAEGDLTTELAACARTHQEALDRMDAAAVALQSRRAEQQRQADSLAAELDQWRPLAEAKQAGKWWTGTWWKATFTGNAPEHLTELQARRQAVETVLAAIAEEEQGLDRERQQAAQTYQTERQRSIDAEVARREARLTEQIQALQRDRDLLLEKWQVLLRGLDADTPRPATLAPEVVQSALADWRNQLAQDEKQTAFAREWAEGLSTLRATLPQRLAGHANLVAATTAALPFDAHFGDAASPPVFFDLLVLEQAQLVTEAEFLQAARRARRWVLIAELDAEEAETPKPAAADPQRRNETAPRRQDSRAPRPRVAASPCLFPRLWQHLHCDPRRLPYVWFQEGGRIGCRLRPLPADQRQFLESEPVVDFPDVELRILARPRCEPLLAEVLFPASMSLVAAKEYIFKELQELPVRAGGPSLSWREEADRVVLRLSSLEYGSPMPVSLEAGVREMVVGADGALAAWHTCCLEFDRSAGWQRPRAEEWVRQHLGLHDPGRTVRLEVPYRARPELAVFLSDLLFARTGCLPEKGTGSPTVVEFVPVPALLPEAGHRADNGRRNNGPSRPRFGKGGAGLELDLSDPRHRDRLPSELRPELPDSGLVNYLEAQAVVRFLESLAANKSDVRPSVAVLALYPAQAELIRCLVRRSPSLAPQELCIDVPAGFRERESDVVLLSLTRSHSHRAVTFGDGPHILTLALTRARQKLVVFGDPGTLARRSQWEGAVDHLDEAASARERALISRWLRYLHGEGTHPRVFHLHESSRA
jgi:hypothetical protein